MKKLLLVILQSLRFRHQAHFTSGRILIIRKCRLRDGRYIQQIILIGTGLLMCSGYGLGYGSVKADMSDANTGLTFDIITPQFTAAVSGDSLIFDHAYATYSGTANDQLKIWYSTDGGSTWTQLVLLNGGASGELTTAPPTGQAFVPTPAQWATKRFALPLGTNKLKFSAISAYGNNLYLDNIKIGTRYSNDVGSIGYKKIFKSNYTRTALILQKYS